MKKISGKSKFRVVKRKSKNGSDSMAAVTQNTTSCSQYAKVSSCTLNQWAMDFEGNKNRIIESIKVCKQQGSKLRLGPELEIPGYGCEDHFLEQDTYTHCAEVLAEIISSGVTKGILCNIGTVFSHNSVPYNCRVMILDGKILYIRPKMSLAGDGNYREMRWFSAWSKNGVVEQHLLPQILQKVTGQKFVPFGHCFLQTNDTKIADEICEELWTTQSPHILYSLCGVELFMNSSGSHHQLRKLDQRVDLIKAASLRSGGSVYMYSNLIGCDGTRLNFDGSSLIAVNGNVVKQGDQFSLKEVDVTSATIDLEQVRTQRHSVNSRNVQAAQISMQSLDLGGNSGFQARENHGNLPQGIYVDFNLTMEDNCGLVTVSTPMNVRYHSAEEEIALGPAQWCWDYLRRSGASGFFLPLSGGADSSSTACIIGSMCKMVMKEVDDGNKKVLSDVRSIVKEKDYVPKNAHELSTKLFYSCYMGTENSSIETKNFAKNLAAQVGSTHSSVVIDAMVTAVLFVFKQVSKGKAPSYHMKGEGSPTEDKALQNIQARLRMVMAYMFAQLLRWTEGKEGWLLVLGSANVDEGLRGYLTKYDCSSADLNPIGGICKTDLKSFLKWASSNLGYSELDAIAEAPPSAELKPPVEGEIQKDEDEMGMTYDELSRFGKLRKIARCGPVSMFKNLIQEWGKKFSPKEIADKVKRFFFFYSINRHKMTTITPCVHMENYSPDDNRFDLRQIFYNARWPFQFKKIDELVERAASSNTNGTNNGSK